MLKELKGDVEGVKKTMQEQNISISKEIGKPKKRHNTTQPKRNSGAEKYNN